MTRPRRMITTRAARALLGLPPPTKTSNKGQGAAAADPLTLKELRYAYFAAAKRCHPDMKSSSSSATAGAAPTKNDDPGRDDNEREQEQYVAANSDTDDGDDEFLQITRAYEILQLEVTKTQDELLILSTITNDEEQEFRDACQTVLGVDAEIVEECKQNPIFRQWLSGRTDAAYHWKTFFLQHGGLAPKLRPSGGRLTAGLTTTTKPPSHTTRRKRN